MRLKPPKFLGIPCEITEEQFYQMCTRDTDFDYDVYLSGKMSGIKDFNYPQFHATTAMFRGMGLRVFNPAESWNGDQSHTKEQYLRKDVGEVARSGAIVLLPRWRESEGAQLEAYVAASVGCDVFQYNPQTGKYYIL